MNILLLGSGGREHAFAWKLSQSKNLSKLFIAPGNAGTALCGTNVAMSATDFPAIEKFVLENNIQLVLVGPEDPLVLGIYDYFQQNEALKNIPVVGPSKEGAQLEGSKDFAKEFMTAFNIPTARYKSFTKENLSDGFEFLQSLKPPYVLKADGLAAGKGVVILDDLQEAKNELSEMLLQSKFGNSSATVVIEEFLRGIELSVFVLTDGENYKVLPSAKDYKRIGEGDTGPNTGGMGAVSPVPFADESFLQKVEEQVIIPTMNGLKQRGIVYKGFIFIGLMNVDGNPQVIEYNCRMGDPETEVVIPRIQSDLVDLLRAVAEEKLNSFDLQIDSRTACTVMLVSNGYPGNYEKEKTISGLKLVKDSVVFHAGTKILNGNFVSNGGRVLAITSYGDSIEDALNKSYTNAALVQFENKNYRKDIGLDLVNYKA